VNTGRDAYISVQCMPTVVYAALLTELLAAPVYNVRSVANPGGGGWFVVLEPTPLRFPSLYKTAVYNANLKRNSSAFFHSSSILLLKPQVSVTLVCL